MASFNCIDKHEQVQEKIIFLNDLEKFSSSKDIIKQQIIQASSLSEAIKITKINYIKSQVYGTLFEKRYKHLCNGISSNKGDCRIYNYITEIKTSLPDLNKPANFVQIRLFQIQFYILIFCFENESPHICLLNQYHMTNLIQKFGHYAHGSIKEFGTVIDNINNPDREFALRPKNNSLVYHKILEHEIEENQIFNKNVWEERK